MGPKELLGLCRESQGSGKVIAVSQLLPSLHLLRCSHLRPVVGGHEGETGGDREGERGHRCRQREEATDPDNCQVSLTLGPLALLLEAASPMLSL